MHLIDYGIVATYLGSLAYLGFSRRAGKKQSAVEFILGGRALTLPAFVASLVSTWYGGILGVGEFTYRYGIANWLVFGVPYYLAALLFALYLAKRARQSEVLTIPDTLHATYGRGTAIAGAIILFLTTLPGAYILMLAILLKYLFGWPFWLGAVLGTIFSIFYIHMGGFRSVVRTDILQFVLMYVGFIVMFIMLVWQYGGLPFIRSAVPSTHLAWHGGNSGWYIAIWYVIALQTLVEPAFYSRCYAAKDPKVARNGILISILCWMVFDFLTTSCGLYVRAILPNLEDPAASYVALANLMLPAGIMGIFALSLLTTVHSTVDSYFFIAATTFGRDIVWRIFRVPEERITHYTRMGLILSAVIALGAALYFKSIIDIWHDFGSVGTPALLLPLFTAMNNKRLMSPRMALLSVLTSGGISLLWLLSRYWTGDGQYWYGLEPIFPGLIISIAIYSFGRKQTSCRGLIL
ncbi:MAG: sodium:solute symporter family protein [candidate division Zixibacteria bacterium]|nr:sodium:solute symporter family protein [candidate division Zixibacteria bacterium]